VRVTVVTFPAASCTFTTTSSATCRDRGQHHGDPAALGAQGDRKEDQHGPHGIELLLGGQGPVVLHRGRLVLAREVVDGDRGEMPVLAVQGAGLQIAYVLRGPRGRAQPPPPASARGECCVRLVPGTRRAGRASSPAEWRRITGDLAGRRTEGLSVEAVARAGQAPKVGTEHLCVALPDARDAALSGQPLPLDPSLDPQAARTRTAVRSPRGGSPR
jgi:hypothetical protein